MDKSIYNKQLQNLMELVKYFPKIRQLVNSLNDEFFTSISKIKDILNLEIDESPLT